MCDKLGKFNIKFCGKYKSVLYLLECNLLYNPYENKEESDAFITNSISSFADEITEELSRLRCSLCIEDLLSNEQCTITTVPSNSWHNKKNQKRKRSISINVKFWIDVLNTFIKIKHDTPSCIQLWKWAESEHREHRSIEKSLLNWNIRMNDKILLFGESNKTTYTAYRKLFERHINTTSLNAEALKAKIKNKSATFNKLN